MSVSRMKNLIILVLSICAACLLAVAVPNRLSQTHEQRRMLAELKTLYESYGLRIELDELPRSPTLYSVELSESGAQTAAQALLGQKAVQPDGGDRFESEYTSELGTLTLTRTGGFSAVLTGGAHVRNYEKSAAKLLHSMGFQFQQLSRRQTEAGVTLEAEQTLLGVPVFGSGLTLSYADGQLQRVEGTFYTGSESITRVSEQESISGADALARLRVIYPNLMQLDHAAFEKLLNGKVWQWQKGQSPDAYIIHGAADIAKDADFQAGRFSIQSESSMFAALALTVRPGMQVLDVCAAPGGKTCYLAERMNGTGRVQSWDLHEHRVRLIEAQARRLHLDNVRPMARDATVLRDELVQTMDAVLLDAPCSGTGVMAGKPDVKYRINAEGVEALTETQRKLLDTCCQYVKRGGQLVYSTCSILPEENARQLHAFLERHPEFELMPLPETFPAHLRDHAGADGLQILPCRDGLDGFFIALMRRKA